MAGRQRRNLSSPSMIFKQSAEIGIEEVMQECIPRHREEYNCHLKQADSSYRGPNPEKQHSDVKRCSSLMLFDYSLDFQVSGYLGWKTIPSVSAAYISHIHYLIEDLHKICRHVRIDSCLPHGKALRWL